MFKQILLLPLMCFCLATQGQAETSQTTHSAIHPEHITTLAASCAACHGTQGNSVGVTPVLSGLNTEYFIAEMLAFKQEIKPSTVMHRHAKGLTNEEITLLAEYFSKQTRSTTPRLKSQALDIAHD